MVKLNTINEIDSTPIRVYNTELKKPICQFSTKMKAANVFGTNNSKIHKMLAGNYRYFVKRDEMWVTVRMRASDDTLKTDPTLGEYVALIAAQRVNADNELQSELL